MRNKLTIFSLIWYLVISFIFPSPTIAATPLCSEYNVNTSGNSPIGKNIPDDAPSSTSFTFTIGPLVPNKTYHLKVDENDVIAGSTEILSFTPAGTGDYVFHEVTISKQSHPYFFQNIGNDERNYLYLKTDDVDAIRDCLLGTYNITKTTTDCSWTWTVSNQPPNPGCIQMNENVNFTVSNINIAGQPVTTAVRAEVKNITHPNQWSFSFTPSGNNSSGSFTFNSSSSNSTNFYFELKRISDAKLICTSPIFTYKNICTDEDRQQKSSADGLATFEICGSLKNIPNEYQNCQKCASDNGVWTALGCLHFNPKAFITDFLKIAMGIAGGIALLLMVYGSFLISTSAGDPKKAEEGKEIITGTIAGLLFIIFSVFILRLIGVDILNIPGL